MKSKKTLDSFVAYCKENPEQRFWQALRNWSGYGFIFGCNAIRHGDADKSNLEDTFYKEEK